MKKDHPIDDSNPSSKSFSAAFEQMAKLLRTEVKLKDRSAKVLSPSSFSPSFKNSLEQIARLLRSQVHSGKSLKKRSWKKRSKT